MGTPPFGKGIMMVDVKKFVRLFSIQIIYKVGFFSILMLENTFFFTTNFTQIFSRKEVAFVVTIK